jgi:hypothetical protein
LPRQHEDYLAGVRVFIEHLVRNCTAYNSDQYLCPCMKCCNVHFRSLGLIMKHLKKPGMMSTYKIWNHHGEQHLMPRTFEELAERNRRDMARASSSSTSVATEEVIMRSYDPVRDYVEDAFPFRNNIDGDNIDHVTSHHNVDSSVANEEAERYREMLSAQQTPLYTGASHNRLETIMKLMAVKEKHKTTNAAFDDYCEVTKPLFPAEGNTYPESFADAKKAVRSGMGYVKYDACVYGCCLYYKESADWTTCPVCDEPRYETTASGKQKAKKTVRHFPLTPQLQKLYSSPYIAEKMSWCENRMAKENDDVMTHPADGEAWKSFDREFPWFASETRNVRLALATDGFCPFNATSVPHSSWPIICAPYNLPPDMCMNKDYNIMTLLISGPKSPGKCLNVLMRPVFDELLELWEVGIWTYDASLKTTFKMHVAVMWTISDFPGLGMLGGIQTKGYKACPICLDDIDGEYGRNRMYYHGTRKGLPINHRYRRGSHTKKYYCNPGVREGRVSKPPPSGREVYRKIIGRPGFEEAYPVQSLHPRFRRPNNAREKKMCWTHVSSFWDLPYWSFLKTRHALDVMHIEKNVCDNLLGTVLNLSGKTKDDLKARRMWEDKKVHEELWARTVGERSVMPHANYTVMPNKREEVLKRIASIRYPAGYAGSLNNKVHVADKKFLGLKTHDLHVLLQRILPIVIRPYVAPHVADVICELACFFQTLCAREISKKRLELMKIEIVEILCKLEMIFPPPFHTIMVHLCLHLPDQILETGPVHYTWMYPIER